MGGTNSKAQGGKTPQRYHSFLASLPKLFAESSIGSTNYYITAYVAANFKDVVFACTDAKQTLYSKIVSQEDLQSIKEALDANRSVGWWNFFAALKHGFFNKKVSLSFSPNNPNIIRCILELNFATIGRTSIELKLTKAKDPWNSIVEMFISPFYEFFHVRTEAETTEKLEQLDKQIKLYQEKLTHTEHMSVKKIPTEQVKNQNNPTSPVPVSVPPATTDKISTPENTKGSELVVPSFKILSMLKSIKNKLVETKVISEKELESFDRAYSLLSQPNIFNVEFSKNIQKEIDLELMDWLKYKFSIQPEDKRKASGILNLVPANVAARNITNKSREEILAVFDRVDEWYFDVFAVHELSDGHGLFVTAYALFVKYDLLAKFHIEEKTLIHFLREIEAGYHPNPYHNSLHAADVLQVLHIILSKGGLATLLTDEDIFAALFAAIIHDYDHPGLNNAFQISTQSYLATLYNDRSILENHHCAQAFELMKSKQYNILAKLSNEQRKDIRETIIQMVLATDMTNHAKIIGRFKTRMEQITDVKDFNSREDAKLALQVALKMADVSNPARPTKLYLKWGKSVTEEFYRQGDKEKDLNLPISPLMDRSKPTLSKGQVAFMNYIVQPMYETFCKLMPGMKFAVDHILTNKAYWDTHEVIDEADLR